MRALGIGLAAAAALALTAPVAAQEAGNLQTLADRAAIEDMLTAYYNDFGGGIGSKVGEFYSPDGEMILGTTSYKGIDAIKGMYASVPADAPQRKSFALNILIGNMLVKVDGDKATARLVFTEYITEKERDAPKLLTQGREFDWLVKRDGRWWILKRQVMGPNEKPEGWQD